MMPPEQIRRHMKRGKNAETLRAFLARHGHKFTTDECGRWLAGGMHAGILDACRDLIAADKA